MTVIYLIRHGQASFGQQNYDRLSDLGLRQARLLGGYFRQTGVAFDRAFSGTLERQIDTARAVLVETQSSAQADTLEVLPEFDEFGSYSVGMERLTAMIAADPELAARVRSAMVNGRMPREMPAALLDQFRGDAPLLPSGEAWEAFQKGVMAGLGRVRAAVTASGRAAVFTSGGTISAALQGILDLGPAHLLGLARQTRNTSFSTVVCRDSRFSLSGFNAVPHLELENDPALITTL